MYDLNTTYVGMDVHQNSISIAALLPGRDKPEQFETPNTPLKVRKLIRTLKKLAPGPLRCCYEAGPCGFVLQRQFAAQDIPCEVIAPSLVPRKPGERIKNDTRDAAKLAHYLRSGDLTVVVPPDEADEAARDVCRAREGMRKDRLRLRHRALKLLQRRALIYREGTNWTLGHERWLRAAPLDPLPRAVLDDQLLALEQLGQRIAGMEQRIQALADSPRFRELVARLRCFRGIDTLSAMIILTEIHTCSGSRLGGEPAPTVYAYSRRTRVMAALRPVRNPRISGSTHVEAPGRVHPAPCLSQRRASSMKHPHPPLCGIDKPLHIKDRHRHKG